MSIFKKSVCIFLTVLTLVSAFSFNVSASNSATIDLSNSKIEMFRGNVDFSSTAVIGETQREYNGKLYTFNTFSNSNSSYYERGEAKYLTCLNLGNALDLKTQYKIKFSYRMNANFNYQLQISYGDLVTGNSISLYDHNGSSYEVQDVEFNFSLLNSGIISTSDQYLIFSIVVPQGVSYNFSFWLTDIEFEDMDDDSNFKDGILNFLSRIYHSIAGGTDREGTYHEGIVQGIKNGLTNLGTQIGGFFDALWNDHLKTAFDDFKTKLETVIIDIKNLPQNIADKISEFFTMLKNYILYFQHPVTLDPNGVPIGADGKPVYKNPFSEKFESIANKIEEWVTQIQEFINTISLSSLNVTTYLNTFKQGFNRLLSSEHGIPFFGIVVTFALVLIVIKKVVGR